MAQVEKYKSETITLYGNGTNIEIKNSFDPNCLFFYMPSNKSYWQREQIKEMVQHFCHWLETGSLDYLKEADDA